VWCCAEHRQPVRTWFSPLVAFGAWSAYEARGAASRDSLKAPPGFALAAVIRTLAPSPSACRSALSVRSAYRCSGCRWHRLALHGGCSDGAARQVSCPQASLPAVGALRLHATTCLKCSLMLVLWACAEAVVPDAYAISSRLQSEPALLCSRLGLQQGSGDVPSSA
jgi:hypothetical protein